MKNPAFRHLVLLMALLMVPAILQPLPASARAPERLALGPPRVAPPTAFVTVSPSGFRNGASLQGGGDQLDTLQRVLAIRDLMLDIIQGKQPSGSELIFQAAQQSARGLLPPTGTADLFFLDFGNPDLRINEFAATLARNLLSLTPLYLVGYLVMLVYDVWRERPIPNPVMYAGLVLGVMIFLAAFGVITQGLSEVGRAVATTLGASGDAMFARESLLVTVTRVLANLQKSGGILSVLALLVAIVETLIILIQLAYRGLSMAIWRLLGVLLIPVSVLMEGVRPKAAGRVLSGFFEAWLDMVGKITLLLLVLSVATADSLVGVVWLILPAGLLIVVLSWKFLGVIFAMIRDAVAREWEHMVPAPLAESIGSLPAAAEAARAREIDEERRRLLEE